MTRNGSETQRDEDAELLAELRRTMTNRVLWCIVVLAGVVQVVVILEELKRERYDVIAIYMSLYLMLVAIAAITSIPFRIRASAAPVVFFVIGISELWLYTIVSNAMLYFAAAVLLIGILIGARAGWAMLTACMLSTGVFARLYIDGRLPTQPAPAHLELSRPELSVDTLNWITISIPFFFLTSALLVCYTAIMRALARNYEHANLLVSELTREIEERTNAVEALEKSERRLQEAQSIAHIGSFDWNATDNKVRWSDEAYRIFGVPPHTEPNRQLVREMTLAEDIDALDAVFDKSKSATPKQEVEFRIERSEGQIRTLIGRLHTDYDSEGRRIRLSGTVQDVTTERQREEHERELELQLQQSQKMEAVGHLAGGIAHDFNNILQTIAGYSELAMTLEPDVPDSLAMYLEQISEGGRRGSELVEQLLAFSRKDIPERSPISIGIALQGALKFIRNAFAANVEIVINIETDDDTVIANKTQIQQIITNLCTNAAQAIGGSGGTITITLGSRMIADYTPTATGALAPGDFVVLTVEDDGRGIEPEDISKVFDPFFTTKPVGEGTGLGLSMLHGIVLSMGGQIDIQSEVGSGSRFIVYMPHYLDSPCETEVETHATTTPTFQDCGRVLVVDDDPSIAALMTHYLSRIGLTAATFTDPLEALEAFKKDSESYSIVLSDFSMPKLNGLDLANRIRAIDSSMPIVLISGRIDRSASELDTISDFLPKPVRLEHLREVLHRNLSRR